MKRILLLLALALSLLLLTGCWGSDGKPGTLTLATALDAAGQPVESTTHFSPGATVYLAAELVEAYEGLEVKVTWVRGSGAEKTVLKEETLRAERAVDTLDPLWLSAALTTAADWPAGSYTCQVFIPDQGTTELNFTLE